MPNPTLHPQHQEWADRQRLTNKLVRFCYNYLSQTNRLNAETIHALCKLTWITGGEDHHDNFARLFATKIPALETIFLGNYQQGGLEDIAKDIQAKSGAPKLKVTPLIMQHTGFTNFYNVYRNSSLTWIKANLETIKSILSGAAELKSDNQGAMIVSEIDNLPGILAPSETRSTHSEYLLTPVCFCLDPRLRFPIINGSENVKILLQGFQVLNSELVDKYSALVTLLGQPGIKDAADLDQIRSWNISAVTALKKQFRLAIPKSKDLALKDEEDYEVLRKNLSINAKRIHNNLTNQLITLFDGRIVEGSDSQCKFDALVKDHNKGRDLLIEVKSSTEIADVRMAIGQLLDYHRQLDNRNNVSMAVLLPKEPDRNVKDLLKYAKIGLLWFKGDKLIEVQ
jgi:hypothetical protein